MSQSLKNSKIFYERKSYIVIFLIIILSIPCFLLIGNIELPGLYVDDSRIMHTSHQLIKNEPMQRSVTIFDQVFIIGKYYNGPTSFYILGIPLVYLFGPSIITLRILGIILLISITIFTYLFAKELFNYKIGLVSAGFFAFMPAAFLYTKYPTVVDTIMLLFLVVSFYFLIKWKNTKKTSHMAAAFIFLGLGFDEKILFIWVILALISAFIIFRPKFNFTIKNIGLIIVSSIAGAFLFVVRWIVNFENSFKIVSQQTITPRMSASNLEIIPNLVLRFEHAYDLMAGGVVSRFFGGNYSNDSFAIFFFISIAGIILIQLYHRDQYFRRSYFLVLSFFIILTLSIFTLTTRNPSSLIILLPINAIIMAFFLVTISEKIRKFKKGKILAPGVFFGIMVFLLIGNVVLISDYKALAEQTGGPPAASVLFLEAGRYLLEQNYSKATTLDVALFPTIYVAAEGKVDVNHFILWDNRNKKFEQRYINWIKGTLNDPEMVYLKFSDEYNSKIRETGDVINKALEQENKKFVIIKTFTDSNGVNHTTIYKAIDK